MKKIVLVLAGLLWILQACAPPNPASRTSPDNQQSLAASVAPKDTLSLLKQLGGTPCPDSKFTCISLSVPLDHFNAGDNRAITVVFAILPASGERRGMFVAATDGPGSSGLLRADSYVASLEPSVAEHFDIVFFDQRGVGASGGLQCMQAASAYHRIQVDAGTSAGEFALIDSARTFAKDCVAEMDHPDWLPFLGTNQAVEDLEAFRKVMGEEKLWLYGESYGTRFAQTYAAAHPGHVAGLVLDGTIDLTLTGAEFMRGQAHAFNDILISTLNACDDDEQCNKVVGGNAILTYTNLAKRLDDEQVGYNFPLPSGELVHRIFTRADLEAAVSSYLYSETARMIFLRALAAYARSGTLVPMARLLYDSLKVDPVTLAPIPDPSFSEAEYFAVECQDYAFFSGASSQRAAAYLQAGNDLDKHLPNFASRYYADLPCTYWPDSRTDESRPEIFKAIGITTLVLGGTADPATPILNGQAVYRHLADGYMVIQSGGPHVIFGRGEPCVDDLVTAFLVDNQLPKRRDIGCPGEVISNFVPLAPLHAEEIESPLQVLSAIDDQITYLPEYYYWDRKTPMSIGCPYGGSIAFQPDAAGDSLSLMSCSFTKDFFMTGTGSHNYSEGSFSMDLSVGGYKSGSLSYQRDGHGTEVTGVYGKKTFNMKK